MKEFSREIVEIDGKDYTLFLNRKGIVAFEKFAKEESNKASKLEKKYNNLIEENNANAEITTETNPFEGLESIDDFDEDRQTTYNLFKKLYWIMLYTEHKFNIEEASEVYSKMVKEYGEEQVYALANQMITEANQDNVSKDTLKKLSALKPQK